MIRAGANYLIAEVRSHYPVVYSKGDPSWEPVVFAAYARMADTVESIMKLSEADQDSDALGLLRSLYEQAVTVCWVLIDPVPHHERWRGEAKKEHLKLHNDLKRLGEDCLSPDQVADATSAEGMTGLADRALEVDAFWAEKIDGLHPSGALLSLRGMYALIYRLGSRSIHGSIDALPPYMDLRDGEVRVVHEGVSESLLAYAVAAPILTTAIYIGSSAFPCFDLDAVLAANELATGGDQLAGLGEVPDA